MIDPNVLTYPLRVAAVLEAATELSTQLARCEKYLAARPKVGVETLSALARLRGAMDRIATATEAPTRQAEPRIETTTANRDADCRCCDELARRESPAASAASYPQLTTHRPTN